MFSSKVLWSDKRFGSRTTANTVVDTLKVDVSNKVVLITGTTHGIGEQTLFSLARAKPKHIIALNRSTGTEEEQRRAVEERSEGSTKFDLVQCNLESPRSTVEAVGTVKKITNVVHIAIFNAGVLISSGAAPSAEWTVQTVDRNFAINHLGHYALYTRGLDDLLRAAAEDGQPARLVVVSSESHRHAKVTPDTPIVPGPAGWDAHHHYARSKHANVVFAGEVARREKEGGGKIVAVSLHPATFAPSNIFDSGLGFAGKVMRWIALVGSRSLEQAAATTITAALHPAVGGPEWPQASPAVYMDKCAAVEPEASVQDKAFATKLWVESDRLVTEQLAQQSS